MKIGLAIVLLFAVLTLSKIIDARDPYVSGHAAKVAGYASAISKELGLSEKRLGLLRRAAFLHDIGKIAISRCAGTQFDPLVAETYIRVIKREGEHLVVNSPKQVVEKQNDPVPTSNLLFGLE